MVERLSRSEIKRRFKQVEAAAHELAEFSNKDIAKLPGSDFFHDEIRNTRGLKAGARKRHIKYLAKIMREEPIEEILDFLADVKGSKLKENKMFHEAERIRDAIINEAIEARQDMMTAGYAWEPDWEGEELERVVNNLKHLDEDALRKTVYQYVKSRNSIQHKEMFKMIHSAIEFQHREAL